MRIKNIERALEILHGEYNCISQDVLGFIVSMSPRFASRVRETPDVDNFQQRKQPRQSQRRWPIHY